jgi:hypothetical protein
MLPEPSCFVIPVVFVTAVATSLPFTIIVIQYFVLLILHFFDLKVVHSFVCLIDFTITSQVLLEPNALFIVTV